MIDQNQVTMDKANMKENIDHLFNSDDYNIHESPDNLLNDLNQTEESIIAQSAKIEYEIKEQKLNHQIKFLESKALHAEEENLKLLDRINKIERDLEDQRLLNEQQQSNLIQSQDSYDKLVSKLLLSFNCRSIDEIFKIRDKLIEMESKNEHLASNLEQTQIQLSEVSIKLIENKTINTTNETLNSFSLAKKDEIDKLVRQLKRANEKISIKDQEIDFLKSQINDIKQNNERIQLEYSQIKNNSSNFEKENQELQEMNKQLFDEFNEFKAQQSKESTETSKRFKILNQISKRLDPKFLLIQNNNVLYPIFDNLSMLLQGISDMEIDPQIIVQGLMEISNVVQNAMKEIDRSFAMNQLGNANNEKDNEEIIQLKSQLTDYEEQIEKLQSDLDEVLEIAPELLSWKMKCEQLEQELNSLKQSDNQNHSFNRGLSQSPAQQTNRSVFLRRPP